MTNYNNKVVKNGVRSYLLLVCLIFIVGCRGCEKEPACCAPTPVKEEKPWAGDVKIFLENSHSMAGYFSSRTDFYATLDRLLTDVIRSDDYSGRVESYTISGDKVDPFTTLGAFRETLDPTNNSTIGIAKGSPLHDILAKIKDVANKGDLTVLVTDGIVSGSNKQLARFAANNPGRHYNIDHIDNLENDIAIYLDSLDADNSVRLLGFRSNFRATSRHPYFKLDNSMLKEGEFTDRPFYILLLGPQESIEDFSKKTGIDRNAKQTLDINFSYSGYVQAKPTSYIQRMDNVYVEGEEIKVQQDGPFTFGVLLNLGKIPEQYGPDKAMLEFLKNDSKDPNVQFTYKIYNLLEGDYSALSKASGSKLQKEIKGFTHLAVCTVNNMSIFSEDEYSLGYTFPQDNWVDNWSSESDLDITLDDSTTFGLRYFVRGIQRAFNAENQTYLLKLPLTIKK